VGVGWQNHPFPSGCPGKLWIISWPTILKQNEDILHRLYTRGGQTFLLAGQIQTIKSIAGLKNIPKKNIAYFKPKTGQIKVFSYKIMTKIDIYSSLKGPQKMFGGPQFGHACSILWNQLSCTDLAVLMKETL
jgi:hypothetical protein